MFSTSSGNFYAEEAGNMSSQSPVFKRRHSVHWHKRGSTGCCGRRGKVAPEHGHYPDYAIKEVRPGRKLRIRHINASPRNQVFAKDMNAFMEVLRSTENNNKPITFATKQLHEEGGDHNFRHKNVHNGACVGDKSHLEQGIQEVEITDSISSQQSRGRTTTATSINVAVDNKEPIGVSDRDTNNNIPLFLIHGVGGSSDVWQAQMDYFGAEGFEVIAPDIIGHGFSGAPTDSEAYHFKEIAEDLLRIFDLYCKEQNIVIGHSYG